MTRGRKTSEYGMFRLTIAGIKLRLPTEQEILYPLLQCITAGLGQVRKALQPEVEQKFV